MIEEINDEIHAEDLTMQKVDLLLSKYTKILHDECRFLFNSGAVRISDYNMDEYTLASNILCAALRRTSDLYNPILVRDKKEVANLIRI